MNAPDLPINMLCAEPKAMKTTDELIALAIAHGAALHYSHVLVIRTDHLQAFAAELTRGGSGWRCHDLDVQSSNYVARPAELTGSGAVPHTGHDSDCAVHNIPAYPAGPCDCSLSKPAAPAQAVPADERQAEAVAKVVSSGPHANLPLLVWMSADHSLSMPIGTFLYTHPAPATPRVVTDEEVERAVRVFASAESLRVVLADFLARKGAQQ